MKALRFLETLVTFTDQPTLGGIQEVLNLQQHNCEDLQSRGVIAHRAHKDGQFLDQIKVDVGICCTESVIPLLNIG